MKKCGREAAKNKNLDKFIRAAFHQHRYKTRRSGLDGVHLFTLFSVHMSVLVYESCFQESSSKNYDRGARQNSPFCTSGSQMK